jgi:pimeloyl-ACP methyl ester carboxylesterase
MAYRLGEQRVLEHVRLLQRRTDLQSLLRKLRMPCAVIAGRRDPILPTKRIQLTAVLALNSRLYLLDEVGHYPTWEAPDLVTDCLRDWLAI